MNRTRNLQDSPSFRTRVPRPPLVLHPLLIAAYPVLALLAHNIEEVDAGAGLRPVIVSLALGLSLLVGWRLVLSNWARAGVVTSFQLVAVFSYGHLYDLLKNTGLASTVVRHRYLVPLTLFVLILGTWMLARTRVRAPTTRVLNLIGLALVVLPLLQIGAYLRRSATEFDMTESRLPATKPLVLPEAPPDIYYIILDTYTRGDTLLKDYDFDNSAFLEELEGMGFYVASCSRSNYGSTHRSVTSSLNMNFLPSLRPILEERGLGEEDMWLLLRHSLVRQMLEEAGYTTVGFDTGYQWSRLLDADIYLGPGQEGAALQFIEPFEVVLLDTTLARAVTDSRRQAESGARRSLVGGLEAIDFPHRGFVKRELYILDTLPKLASQGGPKFVFAHILIPHVPRVFGPDGRIVTDPGYYAGPSWGAINREYDIEGYLNEIKFVNGRMMSIVRQILADSKSPPIIILQADTGRGGVGSYEILNALYLRGLSEPPLWPSISPVNTFRVVFNTFFGSGFEILPDVTYLGAESIETAEERWPDCRHPRELP